MSFYIDKTPDFWLDSSLVDSIQLVDGRVDEWQDQSGNGRHWTATGGAQRPHLPESGDGVQFKNAATDDTSGAEFLEHVSSGILRSAPFEVWVVASSVENTDPGVFLGAAPSDEATSWNAVTTNEVEQRFSGTTSATYKDGGGVVGSDTETPVVIEARYLSDKLVARLNNEAERETAYTLQSITGDNNQIGVERRAASSSFASSGLRAIVHEIVCISGGTTEGERETIRNDLIKKWETTSAHTPEAPTDEETFKASFEDASGRDPLPTALIERTPARRLANHNVIVYRYPPYLVTKRVPIALEDYSKTLPGKMLWHKDENDALFSMGRWAQIQGRRFTDNPVEVELTLRISDHPESFEEPT